MQDVRWPVYLFVFLSVLVPYVLADLALRLPSSASAPGRKSLPRAYRFGWPLVSWAAENFGRDFARLRPERTEAIRRQLLLAALPLEPSHVYGAQIVLLAGGAVLSIPLFLLSGSPLLSVGFGALFAFCGWFVPAFALDSAADARQERIVKDLPFAIDLVGTAMHAGLDFNAAVRYYVSLGFPNALTSEFAQMLRETELGMGRVEALSAMADRIQSPPFTSFVDAIAHGSEVGASIVGTMKMQGEDMRRARFNIAERKAQRAPSIMIFPMALFIVPAVFIVIGVPVFMRLGATGVLGR